MGGLRHDPGSRGRPDPGWPTILHVDMDAFYASVCLRDRPELRGRPVVVGGGGTRGVVLAANYPARRFGVASAMPTARARRLCPEVVVVPPDFPVFEEVSASVMQIFGEVTPVVEPVSLDEAFLDVSGATRRLGDPLRIAETIRARVADEQRITCSVGIAPTVSVAKLASRRAKPDGVLVVPRHEVTSFLHPLDVGELYGVGERTRERLHRAGLRTVSDVAHTSPAELRAHFGAALGTTLHHLAWGTDRDVLGAAGHGRVRERTMGAEETFGHDTDDREVVVRELLRLTSKVTSRMRRRGLAGPTVTLRVRLADFTTLTRSRTLDEATDQTSEVHAVAVSLYDGVDLDGSRVRLVGVRVGALRPRAQVQRQLELGAREQGWEEADRAADEAVRRFGSHAVRRATLLAGRRP